MEIPTTFHVKKADTQIALEGLLSAPVSATAGAVICHPHPLYGGEMRNNVVTALTEAFDGSGMATLRFNFRGVGKSEGSHDEGKGECDDVTAAVTFLQAQCSLTEILVAGYSFGSVVGLQAGAKDERVDALIGLAFPLNLRDPAFLMDVKKPVFLVSGTRDDYSPIEDLKQVVSKMSVPAKLQTIDGADHFFMGREKEITATIKTFLEP